MHFIILETVFSSSQGETSGDYKKVLLALVN